MSFAVTVTPSRIFNSAVVIVAPSKILTSSLDAVTSVIFAKVKFGISDA